MWWLLILALSAPVFSEDLPPSCVKPIYCDSDVLHYVQLARLYDDSKTFVDLRLNKDPNITLTEFKTLLNQNNNNLTKEQIQDFVDTYFSKGDELEVWAPTDYNENPAFVSQIRDSQLKQFAKDINAIWPTLGRKIKQEVFDSPDLFSIVPVTHGFIIPGGRFKELYYWDTYWIIEGLLTSEMTTTAKGVIENLIELLKIFGHIPNGSRWYYQERSQPPLLTAMVLLYMRKTKDLKFLKANIDALEEELNYWLDSQVVSFDKDGRSYTLLRYYAPSAGPRPESYREDYENSGPFDTDERKQEFYVDIKSAAESGWDFSSRWFIDSEASNSGNLTNVHTRYIIPVDLNSIFANALQTVAYFQTLLLRPRKAAHWGYLAKQWRSNIDEVLWNDDVGIWLDYDILNGKHRNYFYPTNVAPLWMGAVDRRKVVKHTRKVLQYLEDSQALEFPGGVPTSLNETGEQWDFPNVWPPLVSIIVNALEALGTSESKNLAFDVAQTYVRSCLKGFNDQKAMFEKYNAITPGSSGAGGEYDPQAGFGWTNGVALEFLAKYGRRLTTSDEYVIGLDDKSTSYYDVSRLQDGQ